MNLSYLMQVQQLIELVRDQSYDSGRKKILSSLIKNYDPLSLDQLKAINDCHSYDSGRIEATQVIYYASKINIKNASLNDLINLANGMSYDSGRHSLFQILVELKPSLDLSGLNQLMGCYSYDEGRYHVFSQFLNKSLIFNINNGDIVSGLSGFSYDQSKVKYLTDLLPSMTDLKTATELENLLNTFSYNKDQIIKKVRHLIKCSQDDLCRIISQNITAEPQYLAFCKELNLPTNLVDKYLDNVKANATVCISISTNGNSNSTPVFNMANYPKGSKVTINGMTFQF